MIVLDDQAKHSFLIVLTGALGDIVRGAVVASDLKTRYQNCSVSWLVEEKWADVLKLNRSVDKVFTFSRKKPIGSWIELLHQFHSQRFTVILDLQRILKSALLSRCCRSKYRLGVHRKNSKELNWIFQNHWASYVPDSENKVHLYRAFSSALGCDSERDANFGWIAPPLTDKIRSVFGSGEKVVSVLLGSSWSSKDWFAQGYAELLRLIQTLPGVVVVLLGDSSQIDLASRLERIDFLKPIHNLVGKTSLSELFSVLGHSALAVGPDSGPGHISVALNTPYVALFGPTDPARVAPYGPRTRVVQSDLGCMPCNRRVCPGLDKLCMRSLSVDHVFSAVRDSLAMNN